MMGVCLSRSSSSPSIVYRITLSYQRNQRLSYCFALTSEQERRSSIVKNLKMKRRWRVDILNISNVGDGHTLISRILLVITVNCYQFLYVSKYILDISIEEVKLETTLVRALRSGSWLQRTQIGSSQLQNTEWMVEPIKQPEIMYWVVPGNTSAQKANQEWLATSI